jgi:hypothetical protein
MELQWQQIHDGSHNQQQNEEGKPGWPDLQKL